VQEFEAAIVVYFGSTSKRINVYTLASTLVSIADAVKEANGIVNPGYEVQVVVGALADGNFKAVLRTIYKELGNLFSEESLRTIVLAMIATYIYEHTLAPDREVEVSVDQHDTIIEQGDTKIIVPKDVYESKEPVEESERFRNSISRTFRSLDDDQEVECFGFSRSVQQDPDHVISRDRFPLLESDLPYERDEREIVERVELQILRAILDKTRRRWEFVWQGVKISAPILDEDFYRDFFAHKITIAPVDSLECENKIYQKKESSAGIFTKSEYDIVRVIRHIPKVENRKLFE